MRIFNCPIALLPGVSLSDRQNLPEAPGVYYAIQFFIPWRTLYVGMAGDMHERWNGRGTKRHHHLTDLSKLWGVRLHYRVTRTRDDARDLEADEIARLKPKRNRRNERRRFSLMRELKDCVIDSVFLGVIMFVVINLLSFTARRLLGL